MFVKKHRRFMFGVLCGAVLFTWSYNGTGGNVLGEAHLTTG